MAARVKGRLRTHAALAVPSRAALMEALEASPRPLHARELAVASGLHVSTVRFHMKVLREANLIRGEHEERGTRGRPRVLYAPTRAAAVADDTGEAPAGGYRLLAMSLAGHWGGSPAQRSRKAERAGRSVARQHGLGTPGAQPLTADESLAQMLGLFRTLGFEPDVVRDADKVQLDLNACPFRDIALQYPEVVCSLHLGLLRGALAERKAPLIVRDLQPFVQPSRCVANLSITAGAEAIAIGHPTASARARLERDAGPTAPIGGDRERGAATP